MLHEAALIDQFCAAMREQKIDISPADIVADGRFHRVHVEGDRNKSKNGWFVLHPDGERPSGAFGCNKRYGNTVKFTWSAEKPVKPLTAAERRKWREEMTRKRREREAEERAAHEAARAEANRIWEAARDATEHPYLKRKGVRAHGLRIGTWEKINTATGEIRIISKLALLVPIRDAKKQIHSLQAIFPNDKNALGRDKDYLSGGEKRGLFYSIGKPVVVDGKLVIIICEGYATGATVHECTGHAVIVAFDAPNLLEVAKAMRARFADATIILAADNDRWTLTPVENPGVTAARAAADAVGGLVAVPEFADLSGHPTDFNDLQRLEGPEAVAGAIDVVLHPPPAPPPDDDEPPPWEGEADFPPSSDAPTPAQDEPGSADGDPAETVAQQGGFTILGYDHGEYYLFLHEKKQIMPYTRRDFSASGLVEIADQNFWELNFPGQKGGVNTTAAANFIIRVAHKRGIYDPNNVRASGAWIDDGRYVFHHGSYLSVDGVRTDVTRIKSRYIYELTRTLPPPSETPLSDADGARILDVAKMFRWSRPGSGALLAGWIFLAPICGALPWRPHIWLTGQAGNGKSTILEKFIFPLIGKGACIYGQGNSTEAGVRQAVGSHALPVLLDEAEKNSEKETARVEALLSLIRQSSTKSDAETLKGTVSGDGMSFHVRSMFCLASILVGLDKKADIDRLSILTLLPSRGAPGAIEHWERTSSAVYDLTRDSDLRGRMLHRAINMMPIVRDNIEVFVKVAAKAFGSQRDGDQYGTLLAGVWSLTQSRPATEADANAMIGQYSWDEHLEQNEADDSELALSALMGAMIREGGAEISVHDLISRSLGEHVDGLEINRDVAKRLLRSKGVLVSGDRLILSNQSTALRNLLAGTPYAADPKSVFGRLKGATNNDGKQVKFNGIKTRVVSLPLELVGLGVEVVEDESALF